MSTTEYKIKVMQAHLEGKAIESKEKSSLVWVRNRHPSWDWAIFNYRIKKEPKVIYVNEYHPTQFCGYNTEELAHRMAAPIATRIAVKYIEVLED